MMKHSWALPILGVYLYTFTILTQSGFNSFFSIPKTLIQSSLVANVTYLYSIISAMIQIFKQNIFFAVVLLPILFVITAFIYLKYNNFFRETVWSVVILSALAILCGSYYFGIDLAATTKNFYALKQECSLLPNSEGIRYISPIGYETKAVFVSVNQNNELQPGYWLVDITNSGCGLEVTSIGKVKN